MLIPFFRTLILYLCIILAVRLMGKRQVGEMQPAELVITILVSAVAAVPMQDLDIPLSHGLVPVFTLIAAEVLISVLTLKCVPLRKLLSGQPVPVIRDGTIDQRAMEQLRLSEGRDFVFLLTMQNHGGYTYFDFREKYGANTPFTNSLSAESEKVAANFCYLLKESDKALEKWIEELRAFEEPTVVIFFSDHLAPLGTNVLQELGLPVSGDAAHQVPYFIWSNDDSIQPGETDLYAYELSPYALSLLGLCDDPFFAYVEKLRSQGIHSDETYDLLSYDALFGQQYAYQMAGFAPATDTFHIGGDMTLSGFDAVEAGDRICVRPRLAEPYQRYTLYLNGKAVEGNLIPVSDKPFTLACIMHSDGGKDYNRSQTLTYENTDQLLQGCDGLHCEPLNLGELSYFMVRNEALNGCTVWATEEPIGMWTHTALLSAEGIWQQKSSNALHKTLQYSIDTEGRLWVSVPNQALPELLTQRVQQYLSSQQAQLYLLDK